MISAGNGTVGANLGAWRFRADWQSDYQHTRSNDDDDDSSNSTTSKHWDWSRYYAWRALPSLKAKLSLGEDYLNSDIFDGFNYIGSSVSTDDQMLPAQPARLCTGCFRRGAQQCKSHH